MTPTDQLASAASLRGGGSSVVATFDAVAFVTGFLSTIEPA